MKRILISIPVVVDGNQLRRTLESVIDKPNVDVLIINNGVGDKSVNHTIHELCVHGDRINVSVVDNKPNAYVNKSWNQAITLFINETQYDHLILLNSDLKLQHQWDEVVRNRWAVNPDEVLCPTIVDGFENIDTSVREGKIVESVAGVFITMNRKQAQMVYPIPDDIRIWFGDFYIYSILRSMDMPTVLVPNLHCQHEESSSIRQVKNAAEVIEQDKANWIIAEAQMKQRIYALKAQQLADELAVTLDA